MARTTTIQDYIALSLTKCKEMGYFVPNATAEGVITWSSNGQAIAAVRFRTDTTENRCYIAYTKADGTQVTQKVWLRWHSSNLNNGGYYYFVCPVTGRSCRKLYFVGGRFVSRYGFKCLYEQQTKSRAQRDNPLFGFLDVEAQLETLERQRYRRMTYKGKPTPFARKYERLVNKANRYYERTGL